MPVTCVYKHVDEVTRTTFEDVTQVMEEDNIITDDQLSTVEEVTQVVDSDCNLTEEEQKVYELLLKRKQIMAIAAKERSGDEKKQLQQYNDKLKKCKSALRSNLDTLLKKKPKTAAERKGAEREKTDYRRKGCRKG